MNIFHKNKEFTIYSPLEGTVKSMADIPDDVFTSNVIGEGIAIEPSLGDIHAPISSKLEIFKTNHLLIFEPSKGVYIVIHFGIGTSLLKGEGFKRLEKGELKKVEVEDKLVQCDLEFIRENAKSLITPIIVSNERVSKIQMLVEHGEIVEVGDPIIRVFLK